MNIYERIINILLEARVDMFIQDRLDERSPQARANKAAKNLFVSKIRHQEAPGAGLSSRERGSAEDHEVRLAGAKKKPRFPTPQSEKQAVGRDNLRQGDTYNESKNSLKTREFMKSWEGQAAKTASSGSDPAIKAKKLDRAGKMRKAGNVSGARAEIAKSQKLDKPQIP